MEIKLAIPDNFIYNWLIKNSEIVCRDYNVKIYKVSEEKCIELMLSGKVDTALLSPRGYGLGVGKTDFVIIPSAAFSTVGFTGLASIYFKEDLRTIETIATPSPDDFLIKIGILMLAERYNMHPEVIKTEGSVNDLLKKADAAIIWGFGSAQSNALDVSEEWFDSFEMPLPLAMWVCKSLEHPENIEEIVMNLSDKNIEAEQQVLEEEQIDNSPCLAREGLIIREFNKEIETSLDQTLQFLFFHQHLNEIPAVKIMGRDEEKPPDEISSVN
ncbi:MqnA/MqnD/SBP family protein [Bacteroidota bacterium]